MHTGRSATPATPVRAAFVMEQTLGHVTHSQNLRASAAEQAEVSPSWLPIPFDVGGPSRLVPVLRSNWSVRASWRARRALGGLLRAEPHDALIFHTQVTALFSTDLMRRLPTLISLDATPINYDTVGTYYGHRSAGDGFIDRQKYKLNRRALQSAAGVVTWSEWARKSVEADYGVDPSRVTVLAPGAASAYFDIGLARTAKNAAPSTSDKVRLLFVGGDFERKGGPLLLDCMRGELAQRCELHVVTKEVVPTRPGVIVHSGLGPNSLRLQQLFADADAFVFPSRAECLAVVLMEATAAGLPVVTTDVGALGEAVIPNETGLIVKPNDGNDLRIAIEQLVSDASLRQRMGRAGYHLSRQKFDSRRNNLALLEMVSRLARAAMDERKAA